LSFAFLAAVRQINRKLTHVLEGEIQVVQVFSTNDVSQLDYVGMYGEGCEEADLTEGSLGILAIAECVKNLLQRDDFPLFPIIRFPNNSISLFKNKTLHEMIFQRSPFIPNITGLRSKKKEYYFRYVLK
jgi:hypothetical protein